MFFGDNKAVALDEMTQCGLDVEIVAFVQDDVLRLTINARLVFGDLAK
jgi:hypothetical protein